MRLMDSSTGMSYLQNKIYSMKQGLYDIENRFLQGLNSP